MWVLCDREPVRSWTSGRVTLVGDAAHPMLQYLAQGAGMAHRGCGRARASCRGRGDDFATAFRAYNEARYLRTARVQLYARLYGDFYHADGVRAELRNELLKPVPGKKARRRHGVALRRHYGLTLPRRWHNSFAVAARLEESA